jgi:hypothetical protein
MADNTLTIRIEGDASGATASFTLTEEQLKRLKAGLDDVGSAGKKAGDDVASGAEKMDYSMMEARHGVMLTSEAIGIHVPRAVATMIASLGPVGAAFAAAFPILALVILAEKIGEFVNKLKDAKAESEKLADSQTKYGSTVADVFGSLEERLERAGIKMDELNGDHAAALQKELDLIDKTEMKDLVKQFDLLAKAADAVFDNLKAHWYNFGQGSEGAKHALDQFQLSYDDLLKHGQDKEAADLLAGTLHSAQLLLSYQEAIKAGKGFEDLNAEQRELAARLGTSADMSDRAVNAQRELVRVLGDTVALKKEEDTVAGGDKQVKGREDELRATREMEAELKRLAKSRDQDEKIAQEQQEQRIKEELQAVKDGLDAQLAAHKAGNAARIEAEKDALARLKADHLEYQEEYKEIERKLTEDVNAQEDRRVQGIEKQIKANEALVESEVKAANARTGAGTATSADAIRDRMQRGVESVREGTQQLADLYEQDANKRIEEERKVLAELASDESVARQLLAQAVASGDEDRVQKAQSMLDSIVEKENAAASRVVQINADKDKKIAELDRQRVAQQEKFENQFNSMFANNVAAVLQGHESIKQAALKMYQEMTIAMIKYFIEKELKRAEDAILEKLHLVQGVASHAAANAATGAENAGLAESYANVDALATGSGAGPAAPVVIAATLASLQPMVAAAGAVSADVGGMMEGGLTLTHPREAVLTPSQTANFRQMTESGGAGKTLTFAPEIHVHGDFNADDHMPQILDGFQSWMRTNGVRL